MTFLFDIGNVLLDFHFGPSLSRLLPAETENPEAQLAALMERKDDFEAGRIPVEEFVPWAIHQLGSTASDDEFIAAWRDIFTPNEPMWRVVESLAAAGHRLILFSNTSALHCPWMLETFEIFRHFDAAILSHEVGAIKPDPKIYHHAIATFSLDPAATRYIDDLAPNIEAGRRFGLRTWQYDRSRHADFERWLAAELRTD